MTAAILTFAGLALVRGAPAGCARLQ